MFIRLATGVTKLVGRGLIVDTRDPRLEYERFITWATDIFLKFIIYVVFFAIFVFSIQLIVNEIC